MSHIEIYKGHIISRHNNRKQRWYWRLRASNGELVAGSEPYLTKWNAKHTAKKLFPDTPIED